MKTQKVKVTLDNKQSFVIADEIMWEGLVSTFRELASQYPSDTQEYEDWLAIATNFDEQYRLNLFSGGYEEDGWI